MHHTPSHSPRARLTRAVCAQKKWIIDLETTFCYKRLRSMRAHRPSNRRTQNRRSINFRWQLMQYANTHTNTHTRNTYTDQFTRISVSLNFSSPLQSFRYAFYMYVYLLKFTRFFPCGWNKNCEQIGFFCLLHFKRRLIRNPNQPLLTRFLLSFVVPLPPTHLPCILWIY